MANKLIRLEDGTLVEIEISGPQIEQISGGLADKVAATFDNVRPILVNICRPITASWNEISKEMHIEKAEIELGLSFEGEGNLYVTKAKAGANLTLKMVLKPKDEYK